MGNDILLLAWLGPIIKTFKSKANYVSAFMKCKRKFDGRKDEPLFILILIKSA